MKDLNQIINSLVLALSLATIIITLISYLIYKIKQLPQTFQKQSSQSKMEGVFFRKYNPFLSSEVSASETSMSNRSRIWLRIQNKFQKYKTVPVFFGVMSLVIL